MYFVGITLRDTLLNTYFMYILLTKMTSSISFRLFGTLYGFTEWKINEWMRHIIMCLIKQSNTIAHQSNTPSSIKAVLIYIKPHIWVYVYVIRPITGVTWRVQGGANAPQYFFYLRTISVATWVVGVEKIKKKNGFF